MLKFLRHCSALVMTSKPHSVNIELEVSETQNLLVTVGMERIHNDIQVQYRHGIKVNFRNFDMEVL
jgi:hypothetical protein